MQAELYPKKKKPFLCLSGNHVMPSHLSGTPPLYLHRKENKACKQRGNVKPLFPFLCSLFVGFHQYRLTARFVHPIYLYVFRFAFKKKSSTVFSSFCLWHNAVTHTRTKSVKGKKKKAQKTPGKEMFSNPVQKTRNIKGGTNALRLYNTIERRGKEKKK